MLHLRRSKANNKNHLSLMKKMIKYIKRDNSKRLKLIILKNDIDPDSKIGRKARTALHECAKRGSAECLRILVQCNADLYVKDRKGNYPLHLAIKYLLKRNAYNSVVTDDLIGPLKKDIQERVHDANNSGTSCWHLFQGLHLKKKVFDQEIESSCGSSDYSDTISEHSEIEWKEKLMQAHEDDHAYNAGQYSKELYQNQYKETYDDWADRIYCEFKKRHQNISAKHKKPDVKINESDVHAVKLPPFKPLYPSKSDKKACKYNKLFTKKGKIYKSDLPFNENSTADEIILLLVNVNENTDKKKVLREAIRKWHPDKFSQIFSHRIAESDITEVMNIVTHVSQTLLLYGK